MIPNSILTKMRLGVGAAGLVWAMGCSESGLAEEGGSKAAPVAPPAVGTVAAETLKLSEDQLKLLRTSIPKLGDEKLEAREAAYKSILALGKGALEPLREALKTATDLEIKNNLNRLLVELNPKPAVVDPKIPCAECSRG